MLDDLWYFAEAGRELLRAVFCVSGEAWMQADSPGPWPPPRFVHSSAMDSSGRFWLFGGPLLSKQVTMIWQVPPNGKSVVLSISSSLQNQHTSEV